MGCLQPGQSTAIPLLQPDQTAWPIKFANPEAAISDERKRRRARLARLEADIAYFQARLEMIGEPGSTNQMAQRKVFKLLYKTTGAKIVQAKRECSETL